jgi:hypothetical protein
MVATPRLHGRGAHHLVADRRVGLISIESRPAAKGIRPFGCVGTVAPPRR